MVTRRRSTWLAVLAIPLWVLASCQRTTPAGRSADDAAFFAGRAITYVVAANPGGGFDTYARLVAKYLERHLPGVRIDVRDVPGASNVIGTNETFAATPDGLTIGTFTAGVIYPQIVGEAGVRFDLGAMSWIGNAASEPRVLAVSRRSGLQTIADLQRPSSPVRIVTGAVGSSGFYAIRILAEALGLSLEVVPGFTENEGQLALVRGDVSANLTSLTAHRPLVEQGLVRLMLQVGGGPNPETGTPAAEDLVTTPKGRALLSLVALQGLLARPTAGPPGIPAGRLSVLRRAYAAAVADPGFMAEVRRLQLPLAPLDGAEVAALVQRALDQPPDVVAWLREAGRR